MKMLLGSDAGKMLMHEGVNVDNPEDFSREWFAWANSLFALFVIKKIENNSDLYKNYKYQNVNNNINVSVK